MCEVDVTGEILTKSEKTKKTLFRVRKFQLRSVPTNLNVPNSMGPQNHTFYQNRHPISYCSAPISLRYKSVAMTTMKNAVINMLPARTHHREKHPPLVQLGASRH